MPDFEKKFADLALAPLVAAAREIVWSFENDTSARQSLAEDFPDDHVRIRADILRLRSFVNRYDDGDRLLQSW